MNKHRQQPDKFEEQADKNIQQLRKAFESDDFERVRDEALSVDYEGRSLYESVKTD